jgi:hypothetical protein
MPNGISPSGWPFVIRASSLFGHSGFVIGHSPAPSSRDFHGANSMNSKTTGIWFVIAAALLAFIFVFEHYLRPVAAGPAPLLPNLRPAAVTGIQVFPSGAQEISADRANGGWILTRPVVYPAQIAAIGALLDAIQKLAPEKISAAELREHTNADAEFGGQQNRARRPGLFARRRRGRRVRG